MKFFILIIYIFDVLCYIPPVNTLFSVRHSEFSNKRFPVKLEPIAEYRRAKFFENRKKIRIRKSFEEFKTKNTTKNNGL